MLPSISDPNVSIFVVCTYIIIFFATLETITAIIGVTISSMIDGLFHLDVDIDLDIDADFFHVSLDWLMIGKIPIVVHLIILLALFSILGFTVQILTNTVLGFYWPQIIAVAISGVSAVLISKPIVKGISNIMPKVETTAINLDDLIGVNAVITQGTATSSLSAEAQVTDTHGNIHLIRVKPKDDTASFSSGTTVKLSTKEGNIFYINS